MLQPASLYISIPRGSCLAKCDYVNGIRKSHGWQLVKYWTESFEYWIESFENSKLVYWHVSTSLGWSVSCHKLMFVEALLCEWTPWYSWMTAHQACLYTDIFDMCGVGCFTDTYCHHRWIWWVHDVWKAWHDACCINELQLHTQCQHDVNIKHFLMMYIYIYIKTHSSSWRFPHRWQTRLAIASYITLSHGAF